MILKNIFLFLTVFLAVFIIAIFIGFNRKDTIENLVVNNGVSNNNASLDDSQYLTELGKNAKQLYNQNQLSYENVTTLLPLTGYDIKYNSPYYDPNNYDVQYHSIGGDDTNFSENGTWLKNKDGKLEYVNWKGIPNNPVYFTPGSLRFSPSNYVPSYEDTVYMNFFKQRKQQQQQQ